MATGGAVIDFRFGLKFQHKCRGSLGILAKLKLFEDFQKVYHSKLQPNNGSLRTAKKTDDKHTNSLNNRKVCFSQKVRKGFSRNVQDCRKKFPAMFN